MSAISENVLMNSNRVKITYRQKGKVWYGELTKNDLEKFCSFFQWGESSELLCQTTERTEHYVNDWIERFLQ